MFFRISLKPEVVDIPGKQVRLTDVVEASVATQLHVLPESDAEHQPEPARPTRVRGAAGAVTLTTVVILVSVVLVPIAPSRQPDLQRGLDDHAEHWHGLLSRSFRDRGHAA